MKGPGEITIYFVDDGRIRDLNRKYLKKDYPTDVLCFDLSNQNGSCYADIFISVDTAGRNAKVFGSSFYRELYLYLVHGLLHLGGFDDATQKQRTAMRKKEKDCLRWL